MALILLGGVALVWLLEMERGIPASVLLNARDASRTLKSPVSSMGLGGIPSISNQQLIEELNLNEWIEYSEWTGSPFSPNRGVEVPIDVDWLDTPVNFHWELDDRNSLSVIWDADWDKIEKQNILSCRELVLRFIFTSFAVTSVIWMYRPTKRAT